MDRNNVLLQLQQYTLLTLQLYLTTGKGLLGLY